MSQPLRLPMPLPGLPPRLPPAPAPLPGLPPRLPIAPVPAPLPGLPPRLPTAVSVPRPISPPRPAIARPITSVTAPAITRPISPPRPVKQPISPIRRQIGPPRRTSKYLSTSEKARVLGTRAIQLESGAPPHVEVKEFETPLSYSSSRIICTSIAFNYIRPIPGQEPEEVFVSSLIIRD